MLVSCERQTLIQENSNVLALGSGGMGITNLYPMNSYESILQCLNLGADGTEIDVQMTKDSVLVAFHDDDLSASTEMEGAINSYTWAELNDLSYNAGPYTDFGLVRLDTLFGKLDNLEEYIFSFDCKLIAAPGNYDPFIRAYVRQIVELVDGFGMEENVLIESGDSYFLEYFKSVKNDYNFYINDPSFETAITTAKDLGLAGIIMDADNITAGEIDEAHEKGLYVQVWGTDNKGQNIDAINKGPDYIQANDIKSLVELLD